MNSPTRSHMAPPPPSQTSASSPQHLSDLTSISATSPTRPHTAPPPSQTPASSPQRLSNLTNILATSPTRPHHPPQSFTATSQRPHQRARPHTAATSFSNIRPSALELPPLHCPPVTHHPPWFYFLNNKKVNIDLIRSFKFTRLHM